MNWNPVPSWIVRVMTKEQIRDVLNKKQDCSREYCDWCSEQLKSAQDDLAFNTGREEGRKEVVEWVNEHIGLWNRAWEWKAKLKEWGIE